MKRYYSLDVFRGATVALMILVNNPGSWSHIYPPLQHASWHGCTPTDLVFPFFLFAVGNAMAFVMPKLQEAGPAVFWKKVIKRTLLIFGIGLLLNWSPFVAWQDGALTLKPLENLRIFGVLQRIALCYFFASVLVFYLGPKKAFVASGIILLVYWYLCVQFGTPGDPYALEGFFGTHLDRALLPSSHLYKGEGVPFDPEGLASTLPAITQVVFGYLTGYTILNKGKEFSMLSTLLLSGFLLLVTGWIWDTVFPINKKIWTSSYVLYTSGLAMLTLSAMIYLIEFRGAKGGITRFFDVFGKNPLFIFVLSGFLPRALGLIRIPNGMKEDGTPKYQSPFGWFYENICAPISDDPRNGSLLYVLVLIVFYWLIVYVLDKRKIYIRV